MDISVTVTVDGVTREGRMRLVPPYGEASAQQLALAIAGGAFHGAWQEWQTRAAGEWMRPVETKAHAGEDRQA